jgi:hypothetical protein
MFLCWCNLVAFDVHSLFTEKYEEIIIQYKVVKCIKKQIVIFETRCFHDSGKQ